LVKKGEWGGGPEMGGKRKMVKKVVMVEGVYSKPSEGPGEGPLE